MKKRKIILTLALILFVLGAVTALYAFKEYNRKNNILTDAKPDFTETAIKLIDEFTTNEKNANSKYSGKVIRVTGNIKSMDKDENGLFTVVMGDPAGLSSVRCSIDNTFTPQAAILAAGSTVIIKGICTGYNADEMGLGADVILNRSVVVKQ